MPDTFNMSEVMISYSRRNKDFAQKLEQKLRATGREIWVDWEDINPAVDWWQEIAAGIEAADTFVCVISPDFVASDVCAQEVQHAVKHNKRLIPVVYQDLNKAEMDALHPDLKRHNWIMFRDGVDNFDASFKTLIDTIETNMDHLRAHTRFLVRAREWDAKKRGNAFYLRGSDLREAEAWLKQGVQLKPQPTELHQLYIEGSRTYANRQRTFLSVAVVMGLILVTVFGTLALINQQNANVSATESADNQATAEARGTEALINLYEAETQAAIAATNAQDALFKATESAGNAATAIANGEMAEAAASEAAIQELAALQSAQEAEVAAQREAIERARAEVNAALAITQQGIAEVNATTAFEQQGTAEANATTAFEQQGIAEANATTAFEQQGIAEANAEIALAQEIIAGAEAELSGIRAQTNRFFVLVQDSSNRPEFAELAITVDNQYRAFTLPTIGADLLESNSDLRESYDVLQTTYNNVGFEVTGMLQRMSDTNVGLQEIIEFPTRSMLQLALYEPQNYLVGLNSLLIVIMDASTGELIARVAPSFTCQTTIPGRTGDDRFQSMEIDPVTGIVSVLVQESSSREDKAPNIVVTFPLENIDYSLSGDSLANSGTCTNAGASSFMIERQQNNNNGNFVNPPVTSPNQLFRAEACDPNVREECILGDILVFKRNLATDEFGDDPVTILEGHTARIKAIIFSLDSLTLYTASYDDGTTRIWNLDGLDTTIGLTVLGGATCTDTGLTDLQASITATGDFAEAYYIETETSQFLLLRDKSSGQEECLDVANSIQAMAFSPDGRSLLAGTVVLPADKTEDGELCPGTSPPPNPLRADLVEDHTSELRFSCVEFYLWGWNEGNWETSLSQFQLNTYFHQNNNVGAHRITNLQFLGSNGQDVSYDYYRNKIHSTVKFNLNNAVGGDTSPYFQNVFIFKIQVSASAFSPDGIFQVTGAWNGTLSIYSNEGRKTGTGYGQEVNKLDMSQSNGFYWIAGGTESGESVVWRYDGAFSIQEVGGVRQRGAIGDVAISNDSLVLVTTNMNGSVFIWQRPVANTEAQYQLVRSIVAPDDFPRGAVHTVDFITNETQVQISYISSTGLRVNRTYEILLDATSLRESICETFDANDPQNPDRQLCDLPETEVALVDETLGAGGGAQDSAEDEALAEEVVAQAQAEEQTQEPVEAQAEETAEVEVSVAPPVSEVDPVDYQVAGGAQILAVSGGVPVVDASGIPALRLDDSAPEYALTFTGDQLLIEFLSSAFTGAVDLIVDGQLLAMITPDMVPAGLEIAGLPVPLEAGQHTIQLVAQSASTFALTGIQIGAADLTPEATAEVTEPVATVPAIIPTLAEETLSQATATMVAPEETLIVEPTIAVTQVIPTVVATVTPIPVILVDPVSGLGLVHSSNWALSSVAGSAFTEIPLSIQGLGIEQTLELVDMMTVSDNSQFVMESELIGEDSNDGSFGVIEFVLDGSFTWEPAGLILPSMGIVDVRVDLAELVLEEASSDIRLRLVWYGVAPEDSWSVRNIRIEEIVPEQTAEPEMTAEVSESIAPESTESSDAPLVTATSVPVEEDAEVEPEVTEEG